MRTSTPPSSMIATSADSTWENDEAASILMNLGFQLAPSGEISNELFDDFEDDEDLTPPSVVFDKELMAWLWDHPCRISESPKWPLIRLEGSLDGSDLEKARELVHFLVSSARKSE